MSICGQKPLQWKPWLCHMLPYFHNLCVLGPKQNAALPTSPQISQFPPKWGKTATPSSIFCCPTFYLFYRRPVKFQPIRHEVHKTRQTVSSQSMSQTQFHNSSANCPNQVQELEICLIKNILGSPNFSQACWTSWTRFAKRKFPQLRTGFSIWKNKVQKFSTYRCCERNEELHIVVRFQLFHRQVLLSITGEHVKGDNLRLQLYPSNTRAAITSSSVYSRTLLSHT